MRRAVRVGLLVLSHVAVMALAAATTADVLVKREWREASEDPMYRISVHFDLEDSERPQSSFESDLQRLPKRVPLQRCDIEQLRHSAGRLAKWRPQ